MNFNQKYVTIIICVSIIVILLFIFKTKDIENYIENFTTIGIPNIPVYVINLEKRF